MKWYEVTFYARKNCWFAYGTVARYVVEERSKARAKELAYEIYKNECSTPLSIGHFRTEINVIEVN